MQGTASAEGLREVAQRAIKTFDSDADLADAWQQMGLAELRARNRGAQLEAVRRAQEHAIASGDIRRQIGAWNEVGGAMLFGRTPLSELEDFLDAELAWALEHGLPAVEADALLGGPYVHARLGDFDLAGHYVALYRVRLARVMNEQGRHEESAALLDEAAAHYVGHAVVEEQPRARARRARGAR
jgi:hypothetical protein